MKIGTKVTYFKSQRYGPCLKFPAVVMGYPKRPRAQKVQIEFERDGEVILRWVDLNNLELRE